MYGRKVKQMKKKGKPGQSSPPTNWGPRIALEAQAEENAKTYSRITERSFSSSVFKNPYALRPTYQPKYGRIENPLCRKSPETEASKSVKKPLSVIIPNEKLPDARYDYASNGNGDSDRVKNHRRVVRHSYDSLPSTETWESSDSEPQKDANKRTSNNENKRTQVRTIRSLPKDSETIKVEVSNRKIRNSSEVVEYDEFSLDLDSEGSSTGSRVSARTKSTVYKAPGSKNSHSTFGINMVYVPMERPGSKSKQSPSSRDSSGEGEPVSVSQFQSLESTYEEGNVSHPGTEVKDPDCDSLLDSFDSILFKLNPRSVGNSASPGNSSGLGSTASQNHRIASQKGGLIFTSGIPLPLPPKNSPQPIGNGASRKSLRFADCLDVKSSSPDRTPVDTSKSLPGRPSRSFCKCSTGQTHFMTTTLPCGHSIPPDNYSTISSLDSFQDEEDTENSRQEQRKMENEGHEKSALEQLRDLSILIGGNFHTTGSTVDSKNNSPKDCKISSSPSPSDGGVSSKLRKTSNTTSCDSGKGSVPTQNGSNNSRASPGSNLEDDSLFRSDCRECLAINSFRNHYGEHIPKTVSPPLGLSSTTQKLRSFRRKSKLVKHSKMKPKSKKKLSESEESNRIGTPVSHFNYSGTRGSCSCNCSVVPTHPVKTKSDLLLERSELALHGGEEGSGALLIERPSPEPTSETMTVEGNLFTIREEDERNDYGGGSLNKNIYVKEDDSLVLRGERHVHPKCWLAPDPGMGWSDLESLYSQNLKNETPLEINGECLTCLRELSELKRNGNTNTTIDRTKRMFIWLNRRPKEFSAPWWEAKKDASIRWIVAKAHKDTHKDSPQLQPFRESKKDKMKMRLKDEVIRDLSSGKLYTMALVNLFQCSDPSLHYQILSHLKKREKLTLWEIIKILSRKGVYVAQPSDMKLTEGTLRQRRPLRIAAHIALIEAIITLYANQLLNRERVIPILNSFGHTLRPDAQSPEDLVISWINSAVLTLKAYIRSNAPIPSGGTSLRIHRWLNVAHFTEIRDLSDGVGISALFALYFSKDVRLEDIEVPPPGETLNIYETTLNHEMIQRFSNEFFPERIYHLSVSDFLYIHGYMKQNILGLLIDLFIHLEVNPIVRVNRLTHVPLMVQL